MWNIHSEMMIHSFLKIALSVICCLVLVKSFHFTCVSVSLILFMQFFSFIKPTFFLRGSVALRIIINEICHLSTDDFDQFREWHKCFLLSYMSSPNCCTPIVLASRNWCSSSAFIILCTEQFICFTSDTNSHFAGLTHRAVKLQREYSLTYRMSAISLRVMMNRLHHPSDIAIDRFCIYFSVLSVDLNGGIEGECVGV